MKKALVWTTALVFTASVALSQGRKQFQVHPPLTEKTFAYDNSLVGAWNIVKVTKGDSTEAVRYGRFIGGSLKFFEGMSTGKEMCQMAMNGKVVANSVGGINFTLVRAMDERVFDCENFVISMFDIAVKKGKKPFVNFVDGHVIIEIDDWCAEVNGETGQRKNYPSNLIGKKYDTVYLRTCDSEVLRVFAYMRLAEQSKFAGELDSALGYYEDAIKVSCGNLPEPYKGAYEIAKQLGLKEQMQEFARRCKAITGMNPDEVRFVNIQIN